VEGSVLDGLVSMYLWYVFGSVCTGWVGQHVIVVCRWEHLYWMGWSACKYMDLKICYYIHVGRSLKAASIPSACTVEFT